MHKLPFKLNPTLHVKSVHVEGSRDSCPGFTSLCHDRCGRNTYSPALIRRQNYCGKRIPAIDVDFDSVRPMEQRTCDDDR